MTTHDLGKSYLLKARQRRRVLEVLMEEEAYSDVVREAQELVELALKGILRLAGLEPPHWHDVGPILLENMALLPAAVQAEAAELARISRWLREERELSMYGDEDTIPSEHYKKEDAERAIQDALQVLRIATES
ncbi:MAG: HEPN domain-containing protein [Spirochaetales bacterium]|nr:HEPN domain-containing protein [Spirochaetales bacterium]